MKNGIKWADSDCIYAYPEFKYDDGDTYEHNYRRWKKANDIECEMGGDKYTDEQGRIVFAKLWGYKQPQIAKTFLQ
tara:strand:+ start:249 stop:476 length:228 start_codon:yes stop_codon:yes gene_type:complete